MCAEAPVNEEFIESHEAIEASTESYESIEDFLWPNESSEELSCPPMTKVEVNDPARIDLFDLITKNLNEMAVEGHARFDAHKREIKEAKEREEKAELLFDNAKNLIRNKKNDEAIKLLAEVLTLNPINKEAKGFNDCLLMMVEPKSAEDLLTVQLKPI